MSIRRPKTKNGPRPSDTLEDLYHRHTQPAPGGHLLWTSPGRGNSGTPAVRHKGKQHSAYRIAFRMKYGRDPIGHVRPVCGVEACVSPDCVEDRPTRERTKATYTAVFGAVSG